MGYKDSSELPGAVGYGDIFGGCHNLDWMCFPAGKGITTLSWPYHYLCLNSFFLLDSNVLLQFSPFVSFSFSFIKLKNRHMKSFFTEENCPSSALPNVSPWNPSPYTGLSVISIEKSRMTVLVCQNPIQDLQREVTYFWHKGPVYISLLDGLCGSQLEHTKPLCLCVSEQLACL